jgi:hypothetical protein
MRHRHGIQRRLLALLFTLGLAGCAPLRSHARTEIAAYKCLADDELRRGEEPNAGAGAPAPVTPADSQARPNNPAARIRCDGGLSR